MKIPQTFRPKEELDDRTEDLLKGEIKRNFSYTCLKEELSCKISRYLNFGRECYLDVFNPIIYISDDFGKSRFDDVKEILKSMMPSFYIFDWYKEFKHEEVNKIVDWSQEDYSRICVVYTNENITEEIRGDDFYQPFLARTYRITFKDKNENP